MCVFIPGEISWNSPSWDYKIALAIPLKLPKE